MKKRLFILLYFIAGIGSILLLPITVLIWLFSGKNMVSHYWDKAYKLINS